MQVLSIIVAACTLGSTASAAVMARKPPKASDFAADPSIPILKIQSAASSASVQGASYPLRQDNQGTKSTIYTDWSDLSKGSAISFIADMDVDCDGIDYGCKGNPDGLPTTNWGALSAYNVPFIVIPDDFMVAHDIPGNNIAAVICNGKMFYGILGDSNGDDPLVIGEASWLVARTCFPDDNLDGNKGHSDADVTYIVFTGKDAVLPSSAINKHYITNFGTLRSMGNKLTSELASSLEITPGSSNTTSPSTSDTTASSSSSSSDTTTSSTSDTTTSSTSDTTTTSPAAKTSPLANMADCFKRPSTLMVTAGLMAWSISGLLI